MGRLTVYARPGQQSRIINRLNTEQRSPRLSLRFLINYRSSKALADRTPSPLGEVNIWRGGWGPAGGPTLYLLCNSGSRPPFSPCGQVRPPQVHLTKLGDGTKVRIKVIGEGEEIYNLQGGRSRASLLSSCFHLSYLASDAPRKDQLLGNLKLNCMKQIILQFACEECDFKGTNEKLFKQHKRISALRRLILKELPNSSSTSDRATGELILFLHNINRPATVESLQNLNSVRTWHQAA